MCSGRIRGVIVMKGYDRVIWPHRDMWAMVLSAGMLAVLLVLACAGRVAGARRDELWMMIATRIGEIVMPKGIYGVAACGYIPYRM